MCIRDRHDSARRAPKLEHLQTALTPSSVSSVPAASVIAMLSLFLLAISVGDYFLLGLLGKRVWTRVLFPAISLGFTWYTVRMAQHYVGGNDFTSGVSVIDTNADGEILRSTRLEMLFTATERPATAKVRNALMAPVQQSLNQTEFAAEYDTMSRYRHVSEAKSDQFMAVEDVPPICTGAVPTVYTIERRMRKWSPQLARYTSLGSETMVETIPAFAWDTDGIEQLIDDENAFKRWADARFNEFDDIQVGILAVDKDKQRLIASTGTGSTSEADYERWLRLWELSLIHI